MAGKKIPKVSRGWGNFKHTHMNVTLIQNVLGKHTYIEVPTNITERVQLTLWVRLHLLWVLLHLLWVLLHLLWVLLHLLWVLLHRDELLHAKGVLLVHHLWLHPLLPLLMHPVLLHQLWTTHCHTPHRLHRMYLPTTTHEHMFPCPCVIPPINWGCCMPCCCMVGCLGSLGSFGCLGAARELVVTVLLFDFSGWVSWSRVFFALGPASSSSSSSSSLISIAAVAFGCLLFSTNFAGGGVEGLSARLCCNLPAGVTSHTHIGL